MVVVLLFFLKDGSKTVSFTLRWFAGPTRARLAESADRCAEVLGRYVRGRRSSRRWTPCPSGSVWQSSGSPCPPAGGHRLHRAFTPLVGATVAGILAALVALVTTGPLAALIVVVIVVAVNQIEGDLLQPVIMGQALSLHPLVVLLTLTIGTIVGGIFGAVLAVPDTAANACVKGSRACRPAPTARGRYRRSGRAPPRRRGRGAGSRPLSGLNSPATATTRAAYRTHACCRYGVAEGG